MALLLGEVEQPVAERLAAVVEGELPRPVGARGVVHERQLPAVRAGERLVVVAELVVQEHRLTETAGGSGAGRHAGDVDTSRLDDRLPAGVEGLAQGAGVPVRRARWLDDQGPEQAVVDEGAVARSRVDVVTALLAGVVRHRVDVLHGLPCRHRRRRVGPDLVAGGRGLVLQAVDVHPDVGTAGLVREADRDAVALVGPDHQRLDRVVAEPDRDLSALLLGPDRGDRAGQRVHVSVGIVVAVPVGRDVDVDRRHVVRAVNGAAGQTAGGSCRRCRGSRRTAESGDRRRQRGADRDPEEASWAERAHPSREATAQDEHRKNDQEHRRGVPEDVERRLGDAVEARVEAGADGDREGGDRCEHQHVLTRCPVRTPTCEMGGHGHGEHHERRRAAHQ